MRRTAITTVIVGVLALAPGAAFARGHHRGHHQRGRHGHVRIERFGSANSSAPSTSAADNAGTVASFANGVLTLRLNDGSTVSGAVNDATEIKCESPDPTARTAEDGGSNGDNGSSDDQASNTSTATSSTEDANQNEAAEPTESETGPDDNGDQQAGSCGTASLVSGAVVREAELRVSSTGAAFKDLELVQ